MSRFHDWKPRSVSSRLARIEKALLARRPELFHRPDNSEWLASIDFRVGIDVWDGKLRPDQVEAAYRRDFDRLRQLSVDVYDDGTVSARIARLHTEAIGTFRVGASAN